MSVNSYKDDETSIERSKIQTLKRLFAYLFAYKWKIVLVLLMMGYGVIISLINPLIMESAIDDHIATGDTVGLYRLLLVALALNLLLVFMIKLRMYIMAKVCNNILLTIRQELYTHIQKLDFQFFDSRPTGKILSRIIGDINSLKDVLSNCVTTLIPDGFTVIAVVVIMIYKNPRLALASMLTIPFMAAAMVGIELKAHPRWQLFRKKSANLNAFVHEDMAGIRIIQSFHAQEETRETFDNLVGEHRGSFLDAVRISDAFGSVIDFSWGLGCILLYFTGIVILGVDKVSLGTFIAFSSYLNMFWHPIQNISNFYNQLVTNIAGAERIFEILDTPPAIADEEGVEEMSEITGEVAFEHV
ncbi:MAG: ABC transporter ATP-binding protein, partial [Bacillus sp. (in: Bacteria)]|nr:ABC transporter ATP-binding protein [Bacillus sp. (in: firmicutes)]